MLTWWSVWGEVQICLMLMPVPVSLAPLNTDWFNLPGFTFLVLAHPGSPGQSPGSRKTVVVVVCLL